MPFEDSIESLEPLPEEDEGFEGEELENVHETNNTSTQTKEKDPPPPTTTTQVRQNLPSADRSNEITVRVGVRVRPLIAREVAESCVSCLQTRAVHDKHSNNKSETDTATDSNETKNTTCPTEIEIGNGRRFTFNHVLPEVFQQKDIWEQCGVQRMVDSCFDGYNATIFAYGQTGSGKTYTMGMSDNTNIPATKLGIVPRAIDRIFDRLKEERESNGGSSEYMIRVSFVEILREKVKDLLVDGAAVINDDDSSNRGIRFGGGRDNKQTPAIKIREVGKGNVRVSGCREIKVITAKELHEQLYRGIMARTTGSTLMNHDSSRSHAIFTIKIDKKDIKNNTYSSAKMHLVDLAGAERQKRTGATGKRFQESVNINQGLLALGNVISALGNDKKRRRKHLHVPYRESKLTRMLQDSLGGNARTLMIACVSPSDDSFEETLNTLRYANRAKKIKNRPLVNVVEED
jgi:hypothetical protein